MPDTPESLGWPLQSLPGTAVAHSLNPTPGDLQKSEFLPGRYITYKAGKPEERRGQIVGPDQKYFPSPLSVFVAFPSGFTHLLDVEKLELEVPEGDAT